MRTPGLINLVEKYRSLGKSTRFGEMTNVNGLNVECLTGKLKLIRMKQFHQMKQAK